LIERNSHTSQKISNNNSNPDFICEEVKDKDGHKNKVKFVKRIGLKDGGKIELYLN